MTNYQVFVTPLKSQGVYGAEIEISDWVVADNIGTITRSIDSTDYDIGIYTFNDVTLVCDASDGYLADQTDSRSIFQFQRNAAKIRIVFLKDGVALSTFYGIINEDGSTMDDTSETVSLTIMGVDSILQTAVIGKGVISDGLTFQQVFIAILNSAVNGVLNIHPANINPTYNGTIDVGSSFDNKSAKDALDSLLLPSNSILWVDSSQNVYVQPRSNTDNKPLYLYGRGDLLDRENIIQIANWNNGLQRTFNSIQVTGAALSKGITGDTTTGQANILNASATTLLSPGQAAAGTGLPSGATISEILGNTVVLSSDAVTATAAGVAITVTAPALVGVAEDETSIKYYGLRIKALTVDFVTQQSTLDAIAAALLAEFRYPKPEMEVTVATELLQAQSPPTGILDLVSINHPLSVRPQPNCRLPFIGITSIGDSTAPLPFAEGALIIDPSVAWKVIEIDENPQNYTTVIKLRVAGSDVNDGFFDFLQTESGSDLETETNEETISI